MVPGVNNVTLPPSPPLLPLVAEITKEEEPSAGAVVRLMLAPAEDWLACTVIVPPAPAPAPLADRVTTPVLANVPYVSEMEPPGSACEPVAPLASADNVVPAAIFKTPLLALSEIEPPGPPAAFTEIKPGCNKVSPLAVT